MKIKYLKVSCFAFMIFFVSIDSRAQPDFKNGHFEFYASVYTLGEPNTMIIIGDPVSARPNCNKRIGSDKWDGSTVSFGPRDGFDMPGYSSNLTKVEMPPEIANSICRDKKFLMNVTPSNRFFIYFAGGNIGYANYRKPESKDVKLHSEQIQGATPRSNQNRVKPSLELEKKLLSPQTGAAERNDSTAGRP